VICGDESPDDWSGTFPLEIGVLMTAAQSAVLQIVLAVMISILSAYFGGRVHQWYRQSQERDTAFREGYNRASYTLLPHFSSCSNGPSPPAARLAGNRAENHAPDPRKGAGEVDLRTKVIPLERKRGFTF
jgi:hypothetical protein